MPETVLEASTFTTDVVVPIGTDKRKAATVRTPFQALANRTRYLLNTLNTAVGAIANVVSGVTTLDALTVAGNTVLGGRLQRLKPIFNVQVYPDAAFDFDPTTGKELLIATGLTADRICKLLEFGAVDGQVVTIVNNSASLLTVQDAGGSDIVVLGNTAEGSDNGIWRSCEFAWVASLSAWITGTRGF